MCRTASPRNYHGSRIDIEHRGKDIVTEREGEKLKGKEEASILLTYMAEFRNAEVGILTAAQRFEE
jgi:hypothetical protein